MTGFNKMREAQDEHRRAQLAAQLAQIQNQYAPQEHEASLLQTQLGNRRSQTLLPFVAPQAQADLLQSQLGNQISQTKLPYIGPQMAAELKHAQIGNEWEPRLNESLIGQRLSQERARLAAAGAKPGESYQDPATGEWKTRPTTAAQTQFQKGIVGSDTVAASLPEFTKTMAPYLGISGQLKYLKDISYLQGLQAVGKTDPEVAQRIGLYKQAITGGVTGAAEGLIRTYGLNGTNHALQVMSAAIRPTLGDTEETYKIRIQKELEGLRKRQQIQLKAMQSIPGYKPGLGDDPELTPDMPVPSASQEKLKLPMSDSQKEKVKILTAKEKEGMVHILSPKGDSAYWVPKAYMNIAIQRGGKIIP